VVICLERGADLHMAQLMLMPLTVSCFSKIQIGFTFLVPAYPGCPGKEAVKWLCVCVASCCPHLKTDFGGFCCRKASLPTYFHLPCLHTLELDVNNMTDICEYLVFLVLLKCLFSSFSGAKLSPMILLFAHHTNFCYKKDYHIINEV